MSIRAAFYSRLANDAGVTALVSGRVFPVKVAQGAARPAIAFKRLLGSHDHYIDGAAGHAVALFRIDCLADHYGDADRVAEAVRQSLDGLGQATVAGVDIRAVRLADEADDFDEPIDANDSGVFVISLIYRIQYSESIPTPT